MTYLNPAHCQSPLRLLRLILQAILCLSLGASVTGANEAPEPVFLGGSDSLRAVFVEAIAPYLKEKLPDYPVTIDLSGTQPAIEDLAAGTLDLAFLTQVPEVPLPELPSDLASFKWTSRVVRLMVPESNPLRSLHLEQLASILNLRANPRFDLWGNLELEGTWRARSIQVCAHNPPNAITLDFVRWTLFRRGEFIPGMIQFAEERPFADMLRANEGSIGLTHTLAEFSGLRTIYLAQNSGDFPQPPSADAVFYGDYPLAMPFVLFYPTDLSKTAQQILSILLSDEVAAMLQQHGLLPAPRQERERLRLLLNLAAPNP